MVWLTRIDYYYYQNNPKRAASMLPPAWYSPARYPHNKTCMIIYKNVRWSGGVQHGAAIPPSNV
jgi:hypothetical protein